MYENWVSAGSPGSVVPQAARMTPQQIEDYMNSTDGPTVVPAGTIDWSPIGDWTNEVTGQVGSTDPSRYVADPNWSGWSGQQSNVSLLGDLSRGLETQNIEDIAADLESQRLAMAPVSERTFATHAAQPTTPAPPSFIEMGSGTPVAQPVADIGLQAAIAEQQRQQQAQEVQAAQDRMRQAQAIMNSRGFQESGMGGLSAAERDIVAAAQIDTFGGGGLLGPVRDERDFEERSPGAAIDSSDRGGGPF